MVAKLHTSPLMAKLREIYYNPFMVLSDNQLNVLRYFSRCPQKVVIIRGVAGSAKSFLSAIMISLASRLRYKFVLCATEHAIVDNSVEEIARILPALNPGNPASVFRWHKLDDCIQ